MLKSSLQVLILSQGRSSRFYPLNKHHKSLHIIAGKPILAYTLEGIKKSGLKKVVVVLQSEQEKKLLKKHIPKGLKVDAVILEEVKGQGNAILSAKDRLNDDFFLINPQQINFHKYAEKLFNNSNKHASIASIASINTSTPHLYGILELKKDKVISLVEKPKPGEEPSNRRIAGMYYLRKDFLKILGDTSQSEYSFEKALSLAIPKGVYTIHLKEEPPTLKYPWDLFDLKDKILENFSRSISKKAQIAKNAVINGKVIIRPGAKVHDNTIINGPAYIGENAVVGSYCSVRKGSVLEAYSEIQRYVDCKNSQISENSTIHSGFVGDSLIGSNVNIGANFTTANKRLDRKQIRVEVKDELVDTNKTAVGVFIGNNCKLGISVSTMPGMILGPNVVIEPGRVVKRNKKQKLLVDLDYVLFNTELFKKNKLKFNNKVNYLYPDAIEFLTQASSVADLILFTEGEKKFQKKKIQTTKLSEVNWYKKIICEPYSKSDELKKLISKYQMLTIIDDKPEIIDEANSLGIKTIRIKRGLHKDEKTQSKSYSTVENLREILNSATLY